MQALFNLEKMGSYLFLESSLPGLKFGAFPSKLRAFLSFQMHQDPIMNTSMKKG
jgi:hypothetical protein